MAGSQKEESNMVKVEVIDEFSYSKFDTLKNIERKNKSIKLNIHKLDFNFYYYMYYILNCRKNEVNLKIYNDFRTKIILIVTCIIIYFSINIFIKLIERIKKCGNFLSS